MEADKKIVKKYEENIQRYKKTKNKKKFDEEVKNLVAYLSKCKLNPLERINYYMLKRVVNMKEEEIILLGNQILKKYKKEQKKRNKKSLSEEKN